MNKQPPLFYKIFSILGYLNAKKIIISSCPPGGKDVSFKSLFLKKN